jgi:hypothetical protein
VPSIRAPPSVGGVGGTVSDRRTRVGRESPAARHRRGCRRRRAAPGSGGGRGGGAAALQSLSVERPSQKARRLARALVSDLVVYQPQKREEGIRNGTLRELFRDEIRKSWDEYVAQVGAPVAESTTHFQDALNEVLAGGRKIF